MKQETRRSVAPRCSWFPAKALCRLLSEVLLKHSRTAGSQITSPGVTLSYGIVAKLLSLCNRLQLKVKQFPNVNDTSPTPQPNCLYKYTE